MRDDFDDTKQPLTPEGDDLIVYDYPDRPTISVDDVDLNRFVKVGFQMGTSNA